jgi:2-polyprenyl-6-methoxyphenol hydroxylase-like FAD-dependent oxidoreductase
MCLCVLFHKLYKMTISIIGGGIGGLTTAIALQKRGFNAKVYEAAPELLPIGAGILMASNAMQIFQRLGFEQKVKAAGNVLGQFGIGNHAGKPLNTVDIADIERQFGQPTVALHRGVLQQVLTEELSDNSLFLNKKLTNIEQTAEKVMSHFADGTVVESDILIGSDGVHSATRRLLWGEQPMRFSGQTCWRGIVKTRLPNVKNTCELWGKTGERRVAMIQVGTEDVYFYYTEKEKQGFRLLKEDTLPHIMEGLKEFPSIYTEVISQAQPEHIYHDDLSDLPPLSTWYKNRVILLGDAAHASTPNLGQGGCQAVEDAWYFAKMLAETPPLTTDLAAVQTIFSQFEKVRRPKNEFVRNTSWQLGQLSNIGGAVGYRLRNFLLGITPDSVGKKQFEKLYRLT